MGPRTSRVSGSLGSSLGHGQDEAGVPYNGVGRGWGESAGMKVNASPFLPSLPQMGAEHLSGPGPCEVLGTHRLGWFRPPEQSRHSGRPHGAYSLGRARKSLQTTHINRRQPLSSELWLDEVPRACPVAWTRLAHPGTRQLGWGKG